MSHLSMLRGTRKGGWGSPSMLRGREGGGGCWVPSGSTARPPPSLTSGSCRAGGDRETPSAPPNMGGGHTQQRHPISFPPPSPNTHLTTPTRARGGEAPWRCVCPPPNPLTAPPGDTGWGGGQAHAPPVCWEMPGPGWAQPQFGAFWPRFSSVPTLPVPAPFQPLLPHFGSAPFCLFLPHFSSAPFRPFLPCLGSAQFCPFLPILPIPASAPYFGSAPFCPFLPCLGSTQFCLFLPVLPIPAPICPLLPCLGSVQFCLLLPQFSCSCPNSVPFCPFLPCFGSAPFCPFSCYCPVLAEPRFAHSCPVSSTSHLSSPNPILATIQPILCPFPDSPPIPHHSPPHPTPQFSSRPHLMPCRGRMRHGAGPCTPRGPGRGPHSMRQAGQPRGEGGTHRDIRGGGQGHSRVGGWYTG